MERETHPAFAGSAPVARRKPASRPLINRNQRLVLEALESAARPLKAYDLLERLRHRGVNAPMTVYRALDQLIAAGRVKKIVSLNAFLATTDPGAAVMICRSCGVAVECPVAPDVVERIFSQLGLSIESAFIEAYGSCGCESRGAARRSA